MPAKKGAAKAAPVKDAAPKAPRMVPEHLLVPVEAGEWPTNLDDDTAEKLFTGIENGQTTKRTCRELGLEYNTVQQWKRRHARFCDRLEEAIDIGIDSHIDDSVDIADTAKDRDSAAASKERREGRKEYRSDKRPERYRTSLFKPAVGGGGAEVQGFILVPMKVTQTDERPVIEGSAVRVPNKALT